MNKFNEDRLLKFENYYSISFPDEYKNFLKNYDDSKSYKFLDNKVLETFLSFEENNPYGISIVIAQIEDRLSTDPNATNPLIIPFGVMFAGDFVCFDFRKNKNNPEICIWDHEKSEELSPYTQKVADSFTDFLKLLKEI